MTQPISSSPSTPTYHPDFRFSDSDACDPSLSSCAQPPAGSAAPALTLAPVVIEGDASAQASLYESDADQCLNERGAAALACTTMLVSAVTTGVAAPTGIGLLLGAATTTASAMTCARLVSDYDACVEDARARREASAHCEAQGGLPLLTADGDTLVCLVER